jgi:hypothetical protein
MTILTIRHITVYRYRVPVGFGAHRMMFRPRDGYRHYTSMLFVQGRDPLTQIPTMPASGNTRSSTPRTIARS